MLRQLKTLKVLYNEESNKGCVIKATKDETQRLKKEK